jgi:Protein of unknown function (DUF3405)
MQALLFLTHTLDSRIIARYESMQLPREFDHYLLIDSACVPVSDRSDAVFFSFTQLKSIGYRPCTDSLIPGSNHFPTLEFCQAFPQYEYVWTVEYDVVFSGNWTTFFKAVKRPADLLTAQIRSFPDEPDWYWFKTFQFHALRRRRPSLRNPRPMQFLASFNPLYRLSQRAAQYLRIKYLQDGWIGHHELTMPTLLNNAGMLVQDFGTPPEGCGVDGKWYSEQTYSHVSLGNQIPTAGVSNTLFHPVK